MIVCGWCHADTPEFRCVACGRDPAIPWIQRAETPPQVAEAKRADNYRRLVQARRDLGPDATNERIAELLGVSEKTIRRWMSGE